MKKILTVLTVALLIPFASTALADEAVKAEQKLQSTLDSRAKAADKREVYNLKRDEERQLEKRIYKQEEAQRKKRADAERRSAKDRRTAEKMFDKMDKKAAKAAYAKQEKERKEALEAHKLREQQEREARSKKSKAESAKRMAQKH